MQQTFRQVAQALAHVHAKGVVHRDLKPENIFVTQGGKVALCDFGISSNVGAESMFGMTTTVTSMAGTQGYLAPEMKSGSREWRRYARAVDRWALGCMLLELLLPVFPRVFRESTATPALHTVQIFQNDWPTLTEFFDRTPHMQPLVRLCSQLLREKPVDRLSAHEVLLEPMLSSTTASTRYDPIAHSTLVLSRLVNSRQRSQNAVVIQLPCSLQQVGGDNTGATSIDAGEVIYRAVLNAFEKAEPYIHVPIEFRDSEGDSHPLSAVMEVFFRQIVLPKHGLFMVHA